MATLLPSVPCSSSVRTDTGAMIRNSIVGDLILGQLAFGEEVAAHRSGHHGEHRIVDGDLVGVLDGLHLVEGQLEPVEPPAGPIVTVERRLAGLGEPPRRQRCTSRSQAVRPVVAYVVDIPDQTRRCLRVLRGTVRSSWRSPCTASSVPLGRAGRASTARVPRSRHPA